MPANALVMRSGVRPQRLSIDLASEGRRRRWPPVHPHEAGAPPFDDARTSDDKRASEVRGRRSPYGAGAPPFEALGTRGNGRRPWSGSASAG
jgi:hypothetical protein